MNKKKRIKLIEGLLDSYYESSEDPYESTDLAMELIQNHMEWLLEEVKKKKPSEVYILHIRDNDNAEDYYYSFNTRDYAWEYALMDAKDITGIEPNKDLEYFHEKYGFNLDDKFNISYSISHSVIIDE